MKSNTRLLIQGVEAQALSSQVHLQLSEVGSAQFEVLGMEDVQKGALVEYYAAVGQSEAYRVLMGAVTRIETLPGKRKMLHVRELSFALEFPTSYYLRQPTARDVIAAVEKKSGLHFIVPVSAQYLEERRPVFATQGTSRTALEHLGQLWDVPGAVWYQLPDGRVYWGHWRAGPFTRAALPIDAKLVLERDDNRKQMRLPLIPALRPGMLVDCGFRFRIDQITFRGETMDIIWSRV